MHKINGSKTSLITGLEEIVEIMSPEFEEAYITDKIFAMPESFDAFTKSDLRIAYVWLKDIYEGAYRELAKVRGLLDPDQWKRYKVWDSFNKTQEMKLLKAGQFGLRKAFKAETRPAMFKKGKKQ